MLATIIISLVLLSLIFAGMALRILVLKNGEFKGTCASQSPFLKNQMGECSMCGKKPGEECKA